jgi:RimJ/RimL family protein N-acetyltransferase
MSASIRLEREAAYVTLTFDALQWPDDGGAVVDFLVANEWPFHRTPRLTPTHAAAVSVFAEDVATFWIRNGDEAVGIVRLFDLDDVEVGSPLFDLRIAEEHRSRGIGRQAVQWLTNYLFTTYPALHRIEATTRDDNVAMQAVLTRCRYRMEGRLREAWTNDNGTRYDTLTYAILRREYYVVS